MKNAEGQWQAGDVERPNPIREYNHPVNEVSGAVPEELVPWIST